MLLAAVRLHIHIVKQYLVVPDTIRGVYLGSDEHRVAEEVAHGDEFTALHVQNLASPIGFSFRWTPTREWQVVADPKIEATFVNSDNTHHALYAPRQMAGGIVRGLHHLSAGLNLIIAGTEEIQLFVPPTNPLVLGGEIMSIVKEREQPSWHPETLQRRRAAAAQHRIQEKTAGQERLNEELQRRIDAIAALATSEAVDAHNVKMLRAIGKKMAGAVVMVSAFGKPKDKTMTLYFHPETGGIIHGEVGEMLKVPALRSYPAAPITYTDPDFDIQEARLPDAVKAQISQRAHDAILRLPQIWANR